MRCISLAGDRRGALIGVMVAAATSLCLVPPGRAQTDPARGDDPLTLERELQDVREGIAADRAAADDLARRIAAAAEALDALRDALREAAARVGAVEAEIAGLEARIAELAETEAAREQELAERRAAMAGTLAALQRMAVRPPAALLVSAASANDIVRTGLLLRGAVPMLERQAAGLRADLDGLAELRAELADRRRRLVAARAELDEDRVRLAGLARDKEAVMGRLGASREAVEERLSTRAARAADLEGLLTELRRDAARRAAAADGVDMYRLLRPVPTAEGGMTMPAQGRILRRFGEPSPYGGVHHGMTLAPPPAARVFAPWDGRVVFAGPFRNFGLLLIIDHGQNYHSLIAGFSELSATVGQWVLAGEPIGTTAAVGDDPHQAAGETGRPAAGIGIGPTLYLELRRNGSPVNPMALLAARTDRVE